MQEIKVNNDGKGCTAKQGITIHQACKARARLTHQLSVPSFSVMRAESSGLHHASQRRGVTPEQYACKTLELPWIREKNKKLTNPYTQPCQNVALHRTLQYPLPTTNTSEASSHTEPPTVRLVLELGGHDSVELGEDVSLDDLRVDERHTVDGGRAHHGKVGHVHKPTGPQATISVASNLCVIKFAGRSSHHPSHLNHVAKPWCTGNACQQTTGPMQRGVNSQLLRVPLVGVHDGHLVNLPLLVRAVGQVAVQPCDPAGVDDVDDLHVARKHLLHDLDGPLLECLRHHRVVGVVEHLTGKYQGGGDSSVQIR